MKETIQEQILTSTAEAHRTGLGLATAQHINFKRNGHVAVQRQPGKVSTFSAVLPL
jgi:light-regulated signal transduction histidine kinase (bacteriophytochrome)